MSLCYFTFLVHYGTGYLATMYLSYLAAVGTNGNGGLVGKDLTKSDLLPDNPDTSAVFQLDDTSPMTPSTATNRNWNSGGTDDSSSPTPRPSPNAAKGFMLQVGALKDQSIMLNIGDMHADQIGLGTVSVLDYEQAGHTIAACDTALTNISATRSTIGAYTNRLEHTIANLDNTSENTQSSESKIRDTDMAETMVEYSKEQILTQAGQSMLAQATKMTEGVLQLLGG